MHVPCQHALARMRHHAASQAAMLQQPAGQATNMLLGAVLVLLAPSVGAEPPNVVIFFGDGAAALPQRGSQPQQCCPLFSL